MYQPPHPRNPKYSKPLISQNTRDHILDAIFLAPALFVLWTAAIFTAAAILVAIANLITLR